MTYAAHPRTAAMASPMARAITMSDVLERTIWKVRRARLGGVWTVMA